MRFYSGDAKIAVGTRSAVFLQCPRLGAIIIDEEHDGSYKEHSTPRYNAGGSRFTAAGRKGRSLMGSATPSVESLYAAERGLMKLHALKGRYGKAVLPEIEIVACRRHSRGDALDTAQTPHQTRDRRRAAGDLSPQSARIRPFRGVRRVFRRAGMPAVQHKPQFSQRREHALPLLRLPASPARGLSACGAEKLEKVGSGTQRVEEVIAGTFRGSRIFRLTRTARERRTPSSS